LSTTISSAIVRKPRLCSRRWLSRGWKQHNYPLRLTTEASIDLADQPELLDLMYRANFRSVFIGIETPRIESLKETKKFQDTRGDSLGAKLARIQNAGIDINAGFIVGFDNDDNAIFEDQFRFIQENGITLAMVGMLQAIPSTPLYKRLRQEGRLVEDDPNCNFIPKQMTRDELRSGYWELGQEAIRLRKRSWIATSRSSSLTAILSGGLRYAEKRVKARACRRWRYGLILVVVSLLGIAARWLAILCRRGLSEELRLVRSRKHGRGIIGFAQYMNRCVTHWHFYKFTREATSGRSANL
jgi:radical SAM superfamily enzyme YgiQ (UPF0313 family)